MAAALAAGDAGWLRECARRIEATGVDFIDCNAGAFPRDERALLGWMADQIEAMVERPLSLDSADSTTLVEVARHRRRAALLNSLPVDFAWTTGLEDLLVRQQHRVVLSLRRGSSLPADAAERMRWASEGVDRLLGAGVAEDRILVDAIALPWGDDVAAGRGMLDFISAWVASGSGVRPLVGLGNIGYGRSDLVRIHREWLTRLCAAGVGAVLLDAFDPGLRTLLPEGG